MDERITDEMRDLYRVALEALNDVTNEYRKLMKPHEKVLEAVVGALDAATGNTGIEEIGRCEACGTVVFSVDEGVKGYSYSDDEPDEEGFAAVSGHLIYCCGDHPEASVWKDGEWWPPKVQGKEAEPAADHLAQ